MEISVTTCNDDLEFWHLKLTAEKKIYFGRVNGNPV